MSRLSFRVNLQPPEPPQPPRLAVGHALIIAVCLSLGFWYGFYALARELFVNLVR